YPPPSQIYPLSLHDALPICCSLDGSSRPGPARIRVLLVRLDPVSNKNSEKNNNKRIYDIPGFHLFICCFFICQMELLMIVLIKRSEEHTSELQSRENLVCRL